MADFATIEDVESLWRRLSDDEIGRTEELLSVVSDSLREEAHKVGKNLDDTINERLSFKSVVKSVTVDVVARTLMTSTDQEPMTQFAEGAMGYSVSGSYLIPGGGLFIKDSELKRLGLKNQRYGVIDFYGEDQRHKDHSSG